MKRISANTTIMKETLKKDWRVDKDMKIIRMGSDTLGSSGMEWKMGKENSYSRIYTI